MFPVHGGGGTFGAIATGVFAVSVIGLASGAIEGNVGQVGIQLAAVVTPTSSRAARRSCSVKVADLVLGIRIPRSQEELGLDAAIHLEAAYTG